MKKLALALALLFAGIAVTAVFIAPTPEPAGDICEYYGTTETILAHQSLDLRIPDIHHLESVLSQRYYTQWYCYLTGTNGKRYPIHFPAYSVAVLPIRITLSALHADPLKSFAITNVIGATVILIGIIALAPLSAFGAITGVLLIVSSPLLSFVTWPGPDLITMMLLLYAILCVLSGDTRRAFVLLAIASWQSQPLLVPACFTGLWLVALCYKHPHEVRKDIIAFALGAILLILPYLYNFILFGTLTPWTILPDLWTKTYGFGIQNLRIGKLFEQLADPNIGVFWYAPVLTLVGLGFLLKAASRYKGWLALSLVAVGTLFVYQTNPAWHYGTAGYGPSRHAIVLIPFLIAAVMWHVKPKMVWAGLVGLILVSQMYVLSINNYIFPVFTNSLVQSPMARFILNRWPALYNPTPEIFIDRSNHTDLDHLTTAVYTANGICKKAYVFLPDLSRVLQNCGAHPSSVHGSIINPNEDGLYITYE